MRRFKEPLILSLGANVPHPPSAIHAGFRLKTVDMTLRDESRSWKGGRRTGSLPRTFASPQMPKATPAAYWPRMFPSFQLYQVFSSRLTMSLLTDSDLTAHGTRVMNDESGSTAPSN